MGMGQAGDHPETQEMGASLSRLIRPGGMLRLWGTIRCVTGRMNFRDRGTLLVRSEEGYLALDVDASQAAAKQC